MNEQPTLKSLVTYSKIKMTRKQKVISKIMLFFEDMIKVPLFRCQHCGECLLSYTGYVCSQRCPKRLRNGPCGGTGKNETCEVYPDRKCICYLIYRRANLLKKVPVLYRIEKIHNWEFEKTSAWFSVFTKQIEAPSFFKRKK